jgi:hypothetical protein
MLLGARRDRVCGCTTDFQEGRCGLEYVALAASVGSGVAWA